MPKRKTNTRAFKEEQLKDLDVAKSFHEGLEELRLSAKIAKLREERGLTQTQLAARMKTSTPVISRLENDGKSTVGTLRKVAEALNAELVIDLIPKEKLGKHPAK